MIAFFQKPWRWACTFSLLLALATTFVLLDTFLIPKTYASADTSDVTQKEQSAADNTALSSDSAVLEQPGNASAGAMSYQDDNISITVETVVEHDTTYYVANIRLNDASLLQTALAQGVYGRNIKQTTSEMAEENNAVFAVNGDYYGFRDAGFVVRNGVLYRDTSTGHEVLVIDADGNFSTADDTATTAQQLLDKGAQQVLSFGPVLVKDGKVAVDETEEILGKSMNSNPRTAIGQIDELHYIVIVSDGRTDESAGLSLYQLAQAFAERGATLAYNLDGGGSSTMVLNGKIINTTTSGRRNSERQVSDIVYIGYE